MTASAKSKEPVTKSSVKKKQPERVYLIATVIIAGIIELIDENGDIAYYRQRGINQIPNEYKLLLINKGMLNRYWANYKELPKHYSIRYEDSEILGRASASFPTKACLEIFGLKHNK